MFYVQYLKNKNSFSINDKINFRDSGSYFVNYYNLRKQLMSNVKCHLLLRPYEATLMEAQNNEIQRMENYFGKNRYEYENNL